MLYQPPSIETSSSRKPAPSSESWKSFEVSPGDPDTRLLVLCDHATNLMPPEYGKLGLDDVQLNRHIAYDIGALGIAREIGRRLRATVVSSRFSRLLIDPNRGEDDPTLIMRISDGAVVPGNTHVDDAEMERRIAAFFRPYHAAVAAEIDAMLARGQIPVIFSMHSFTNVWRGVPRKWQAAVLWDKDPRLPVPTLKQLRERTGFEIGDNEPYSGFLRNDTIFRHATLRGLPNVLVEVRQDLIREEAGQLEWAAILADSLAAILADPAHAEPLSRLEYYESRSDEEADRVMERVEKGDVETASGEE
ncbi:N-formylglutamate amidohydrolase [Rhodomicrobium vannielii ATCC 17100]|uniref:N-formylglutamate amidohydrolase n=1 Tax=Rhodomicrobium vannielii (strain ATCC 17100 / DSM 162 / LMG 4299 / NCIMB 10020 / ATH 3.1.1) TaxID=648757 RepID=E3I8J0_RHOVT|nr:N-formylglutamate amidohydrolase [Rhodomicrobium vannielii]ADP70899.1 N-formylglutamate amidohydrolase [Rhodomicrobium vannielii ATCC 17100]